MSGEVRIRAAEPPDDDVIGELLVSAYVTAYAQKMPHVRLTDQRKADLRAVAAKRAVATVLVAELAGRVVGTVSIFAPGAAGSEAWRPGCADLRHLATDPALHGRGLAAPLMDEAEKIARAWGAAAICLHVRRGNRGVAALYQRRGYLRDPAGDIDRPEVFLEAYALPLR